MQLSVTTETILSEMKGARDILASWIARIEQGVPGVDLPAPQSGVEDFMRPFCGELLIVSAKCESLSNVLAGEA